MSGWIKLEKDLREDQRVKRMARTLNQTPRFCNAPALLCVTLVLGGLAQLWMHADSFARDDDTLDITPEEVDELTGIKGFAQILPEDWFQVIDSQSVKLPGFQDHNGSEAKRRALTARRVAQHRKRESVTTCDKPVTQVRYQTRPDQTRPEKTKEEEREVRASRSTRATRLPPDFGLTPERRAIAEAEKADPDREFAQFTDHFRAAPGVKGRKNDWDATWRNWCRRAPDFKPRANGTVAENPKLTWRPPAEEEENDVPH